MTLNTPPKGIEDTTRDPDDYWGEPEQPHHRRAHTRPVRGWVIGLICVGVLVILGAMGLVAYQRASQPVQHAASAGTTPIPVPRITAAPEPTRTGVPELGPDNTTVMDGSNLVAGRHFTPGRYVTTQPAVAGCTWRITTGKGALVKASGGTGPMTTPAIREGQWFTTYGCGDWRLKP